FWHSLQSHTSRAKGHAMAKNTICLWYDKDAEAAARFYAETFPDRRGRCRSPCTQRLPIWQARRRVDGRVHRLGHPLYRPQRRSRVQAQRSLLVPDRHRRSARDRPCSSTNSAAISVCSNSLLPQICNAGPSDALSWRTSSTTSPSIRCDFSQSKWSRLRVTTYFVALLNALAIGLSPWFGQ